MGRCIITTEFVKTEFDKKGYVLLDGYNSTRTKLNFYCTKCSNYHTITWHDFRAGGGCAYCNGKVRLTLEFVNKKFIEDNLELLSNEYINAHTKLNYKCKICNKKHSISWANFQQGHGCPACAGQEKPTFKEIESSFISEGYILLSKEYKNCHAKLDYICPKGHTHQINWARWSSKNHPKRCPFCPENNKLNKGNVSKLSLPLFETFNNQICLYEKTYNVIQNGLNLLGVNCTYCNKVFVPSQRALRARLAAINGKSAGSQHLYCSESCKQSCPTYWKRSWPAGYAPTTSREVQAPLRKLVLERDDWACQKCGKSKDVQLHCHHIDPVINNPIESADADNCITLCKTCHSKVHKLPGCRLNELRC